MYRERMKEGTSRAIINTLDGACKYYQVDFGYYPPSGDVSVDGINQGYQLLPWALVGYQDSAKDNYDGFGFRVIADRGKVYGPYNDAEKLTVQGSPPYFTDSFGNPILYYRFDSGTYKANHNSSTDPPADINNYAKNPSDVYYRMDFILLSKGQSTEWHDDAVDRNTTNFQIHK
jgi:hypothetical protein